MLPKFSLVWIFPVLLATVIEPSPLRVHLAAVESWAIYQASKLVPSKSTMASEGALLNPVAGAPGSTLGGTGSYISVASGVVGSGPSLTISGTIPLSSGQGWTVGPQLTRKRMLAAV